MMYSPSFLFERDTLLKINPKNSFQIGRLLSISLNLTHGLIATEKKYNLFPSVGLILLTGQRPKIIRAKKSVASFKLKVGSVIGCQVTMRGKQMKPFLETLTLLAIPQLKQEYFFSTSALASSTNMCFGLGDLLVFPELEKNFEIFGGLRGCYVQLYTNTKNPFEKNLILSFYNLPVYAHNKRKHIYEKCGL